MPCGCPRWRRTFLRRGFGNSLSWWWLPFVQKSRLPIFARHAPCLIDCSSSSRLAVHCSQSLYGNAPDCDPRTDPCPPVAILSQGLTPSCLGMIDTFHQRLPQTLMLIRALMLSVFQNPSTLVLRRVHVHGNAMHPLRRRRKHVPAPFIFHEC